MKLDSALSHLCAVVANIPIDNSTAYFAFGGAELDPTESAAYFTMNNYMYAIA